VIVSIIAKTLFIWLDPIVELYQKEFIRDLKYTYKAVSKKAAETELD